ncbi:hypothetical protein [Halothermothrix orenii]|uniref:Iron-only hydrogenase system regulator n=1 Tax=Halothermothrix orenii (strain H 168 / OCM 544 / DSM 9562) TaxID=373903 RepID=B8D127_HALOH|nr:hypothetical protein [Halothermothrix orenii]ACL68996.1 hypothetical protein Hore_02350 [Halothermothrix orenii H 168]
MECSTVMAIVQENRTDSAPEVQEILTEFGCIISARIGLHRLKDCTEEGLILLHLCGEDSKINDLHQKLEEMERVRVKEMKID